MWDPHFQAALPVIQLLPMAPHVLAPTGIRDRAVNLNILLPSTCPPSRRVEVGATDSRLLGFSPQLSKLAVKRERRCELPLACPSGAGLQSPCLGWRDLGKEEEEERSQSLLMCLGAGGGEVPGQGGRPGKEDLEKQGGRVSSTVSAHSVGLWEEFQGLWHRTLFYGWDFGGWACRVPEQTPLGGDLLQR